MEALLITQARGKGYDVQVDSTGGSKTRCTHTKVHIYKACESAEIQRAVEKLYRRRFAGS